MSIEKFRLNWRSNPEKQYDELQKMVMHLTNIANSISDLNVKLNVLPQIVTAINNQGLLLQSIADNTACACNGIASINDNLTTIHTDMNSKLDYIAELVAALEPEPPAPPIPVPVYDFDIYETSLTITEEMIAAGSFVLAGVSTKDGEFFSDFNIIVPCAFIAGIEALSVSQIQFNLVPGVDVVEGLTMLYIQQAESNIVDTLGLYYEKPIPAPTSYLVLANSTVVPLRTSSDLLKVCPTSAVSSHDVVTINGISFALENVTGAVVDASVLPTEGVIPDGFLRGLNNLVNLELPETYTVIGSYFLSYCESFNHQLSIPEGVVSIGASFMSGCYFFNSDLYLPSSLQSVGTSFLYNAQVFESIIHMGSVSPEVFVDSTQTLSCTSTSYVPYSYGIRLLFDDAIPSNLLSSFKAFFPDRLGPGYFRKLLQDTVVFSPASKLFSSDGGTFLFNVRSFYDWTFDHYVDEYGGSYSNFPYWLSMSPSSGNWGDRSKTIICQSNFAVDRFARLYFSDGHSTYSLYIEQEGAILYSFSILNNSRHQVRFAFFDDAEYSGYPSTSFDVSILVGGDSLDIGFSAEGFNVYNFGPSLFSTIPLGNAVFVYTVDSSGTLQLNGSFVLSNGFTYIIEDLY